MFILSFALIGLDLFKCLVATGIVLLISVITYSWLGPFLPGDKYLLIVGYLVTINSMVVLAAGTKATGGRLLIVLGASVVYMSDIFLANWQFVDKNAGNAFYCYPLYYTACILLALRAGRSGSQIIQ